MAITYILECSDGRYYVGSTIHLNQRLKEHNSRKCRFTKLRLPVELIYKEEFKTYSEARKREYEIKRKKSRLYIEKLIKSK